MPEETFIERKEEDIAIQIFTVSAAMVGVCLTVIGIINITEILKKIESIADKLIGVDAMLFMVSCLISYIAIRTKERKHRFILEKTADFVFLTALSLTALVCLLIVWEFI